ncbi:MAG: hypothetical protein NT023_16600, partial [Armatimonadetes bacterium]|nr:hypothetical protein [Armatimonadota bacterium]
NIRVIATKRQLPDISSTEFKSSEGKIANVDLKFLWVQDNPFEDAFHLIGYSSLRENSAMKAQKYVDGFVVNFGTYSQSVLSANIATAFLDLFVKLSVVEEPLETNIWTQSG